MEFLILDTGDADRLAVKLTESAEAATSFAEPFLEIELDMYRIEKAIFSSGGRRGGGSWKKLADSTAKRKGDVKILRDTDALYNSLTEPDAPYQILDITPHMLVFGTERPYSVVHQMGSTAAGVPRRPFIKFLPTDIDRWSRLLLSHVMKGFRA